MNRRHFIVASSAGLAGVAFSRRAGWAQAPAPAAAQAPPVTKFEELRRGVGMFSGTGGTIGYLVNGDGAIAVDSQFMNTAEICVAGLRQRAPKGIQVLLNTHHHGDHTGGNMAFKPVVKKIVAHENSAKWQKQVADTAGTAAQQAFPTATFTDVWTEKLGDETVESRHYGPGHTSGDAVIFFEKANVVHGGDLLFRRAHPRIDGPAGASAVNWINVLDRIAKDHANDTIFVFGHGLDNNVRGTKADVTFFRDYLSAAVDHVRKGMAAKQSKDEITKMAALKGFESVGSINPRLTLEGTLGSIHDELGK